MREYPCSGHWSTLCIDNFRDVGTWLGEHNYLGLFLLNIGDDSVYGCFILIVLCWTSSDRHDKELTPSGFLEMHICRFNSDHHVLGVLLEQSLAIAVWKRLCRSIGCQITILCRWHAPTNSRLSDCLSIWFNGLSHYLTWFSFSCTCCYTSFTSPFPQNYRRLHLYQSVWVRLDRQCSEQNMKLWSKRAASYLTRKLLGHVRKTPRARGNCVGQCLCLSCLSSQQS